MFVNHCQYSTICINNRQSVYLGAKGLNTRIIRTSEYSVIGHRLLNRAKGRLADDDDDKDATAAEDRRYAILYRDSCCFTIKSLTTSDITGATEIGTHRQNFLFNLHNNRYSLWSVTYLSSSIFSNSSSVSLSSIVSKRSFSRIFLNNRFIITLVLKFGMCAKLWNTAWSVPFRGLPALTKSS